MEPTGVIPRLVANLKSQGFKVSKPQVEDILRRRPELAPTRRSNGRPGSSWSLTDEQASEIQRMIDARRLGLNELADRDAYCWATAERVDVRQTVRLMSEYLAARKIAESDPQFGDAISRTVDRYDHHDEDRLDETDSALQRLPEDTHVQRAFKTAAEAVLVGYTSRDSAINLEADSSPVAERSDKFVQDFNRLDPYMPTFRSLFSSEIGNASAADLERARRVVGRFLRLIGTVRSNPEMLERITSPVLREMLGVDAKLYLYVVRNAAGITSMLANAIASDVGPLAFIEQALDATLASPLAETYRSALT